MLWMSILIPGLRGELNAWAHALSRKGWSDVGWLYKAVDADHLGTTPSPTEALIKIKGYGTLMRHIQPSELENCL